MGFAVRVFILQMCGHVTEHVDKAFELGEDRMCGQCGRVGVILGIDVQWRAKCVDCPFGVYTGVSELLARMKANTHMRRKVGHSVQLLVGETVRYVYSGKKVLPLVLPDF